MRRTTKLIDGGRRSPWSSGLCIYVITSTFFLRFLRFSKSKKSWLFYVVCRVSYVFSNYGPTPLSFRVYGYKNTNPAGTILPATVCPSRAYEKNNVRPTRNRKAVETSNLVYPGYTSNWGVRANLISKGQSHSKVKVNENNNNDSVQESHDCVIVRVIVWTT